MLGGVSLTGEDEEKEDRGAKPCLVQEYGITRVYWQPCRYKRELRTPQR